MKHWAPYHCKSSSGRWTEKCNRYQNEAPALGRNWTGWCFGCFHSQTSISIWSQGVFDCCPEDGPSKPFVPKSVSLHGDHGQESFVDVPETVLGPWTNHTGAWEGQAGAQPLNANEQKARRLKCPSLFRDAPWARASARRSLLGHCSRVSRFSGWWTVKVELLPPLASGRKDKW